MEVQSASCSYVRQFFCFFPAEATARRNTRIARFLNLHFDTFHSAPRQMSSEKNDVKIVEAGFTLLLSVVQYAS